MRISRRAVVLIAGCGCLLLIAAGVILLVLSFTTTAQSSSGGLSYTTVSDAPVSTIAAARVTPRFSVATVAVLAPDESAVVQYTDTAVPALIATSRPTSTTTPTPTPRPTSTPRPTATTAAQTVSRAPAVNPNQATARYYVIAQVSANARSCPRTSCNVVTSFARGAAVNVLQRVTGQSVSGNTSWQAVKHNNAVVYIHAPLLSRTRPQPQQAQPAQPAAAQPQQAQPAQVSAPPTTVPGPQFSCNCSKTCTQMASCQEAYFQLNQCRCLQRDNDDDGVPCESICQGG